MDGGIGWLVEKQEAGPGGGKSYHQEAHKVNPAPVLVSLLGI